MMAVMTMAYKGLLLLLMHQLLLIQPLLLHQSRHNHSMTCHGHNQHCR
jgi:hypothetical protein